MYISISPKLHRRSTFILVTLTVAMVAVAAVVSNGAQRAAAKSFTVEQIKSYPFPTELTAASTGSRIAWAFNERGLRNIWVAEGPNFQPRRLTNYNTDDGQELSSLSISADGKYVVYVRGGDHGANFDVSVGVNPTLSPASVKVQIFSVPFAGGEPKLLADGDEPLVSPKGDRVVFVKERGLWVVPVDGSAQSRRLFFARGESDSPEWSPDGRRLAFVSSRGDHSFIGIYTDGTSIVYLAPSTSRDSSPRWSPDGKRIAFVRRPGTGGVPEPILGQRPQAWAIWTADAATGEARQLWKSPFTLRGSPPNTQGGTNLHWAAAGRIVFLSYLDGWPHLYSISENAAENAAGNLSQPLLLTPGNYMAEYISISPDRRQLFFAANAGTDPDDIDRRHIVRVAVDKAEPVVMTPGKGLEWTPFLTGDGKHIAFIGATAQRPPLPMVMPANIAGGKPRVLAEDRVPADFPSAKLVVPKKVVYKAPDGVEVHAQLFEPISAPPISSTSPEVRSVPPRGRDCAKTKKDGSSDANSQVRKGGLPPLQRSALSLDMEPCGRMKTPSTASLKRDKVDNATLERGQATLPNLQITVRPLGFSHSLGLGWVPEHQAFSQLGSVRSRDRDWVETTFAAAPPDVRKGYALPARSDEIWGYAPNRRVARGFQPERLAESSRWSQRSVDHRKAVSVCPHSEGVQEFLRPLQGLESFASPSGGLRCATTTGYYLPAFQAEIRLGGSAAAMISFLTLGMTTNSNAAFGFAASSSLDN